MAKLPYGAWNSVAEKPPREGFTLVEMLVALMILAFGLTTVVGVLGTGLATEQEAELVRDASRLATTIEEQLRDEDALGKAIAGGGLPAAVKGARIEAYPALLYDVEFKTAPANRLLVALTVRWLRGGRDVSKVFRFMIPRSRPLAARIRDAIRSNEDR